MRSSICHSRGRSAFIDTPLDGMREHHDRDLSRDLSHSTNSVDGRKQDTKGRNSGCKGRDPCLALGLALGFALGVVLEIGLGSSTRTQYEYPDHSFLQTMCSRSLFGPFVALFLENHEPGVARRSWTPGLETAASGQQVERRF